MPSMYICFSIKWGLPVTKVSLQSAILYLPNSMRACYLIAPVDYNVTGWSESNNSPGLVNELLLILGKYLSSCGLNCESYQR